MLVSLHVKNLALIDETEVWFADQLNILTGETGAGKSVIIGSVNLALGAKADKDMIRNGADYALIELVFQISDQAVAKKLEELGMPAEDGQIILSRRLMPARSVFKCNGEAVSARQVKELSEWLIDIHGQHEHQSLLHKKKQFEILDDFAGPELNGIKRSIKVHYDKYRELRDQISESEMDEEQRKKELNLARFELSEIGEAGLIEGEDEEVESLYKRMVNAQKIVQAAGAAYGLTGYENGEGAGENIGRALREIKSVSQYDDRLELLEQELTQLDGLLNDFNRELSDYMSELEFDEKDFTQTEERLNLLNHLKSKYGRTLEEVLTYEEKLKEKCVFLEDFENYKEKLQQDLIKEKTELDKYCKKATVIRRKKAAELSEQMHRALVDLNFLDVAFEIQVRTREEGCTRDGWDEAEFMISTNPGEPIRPLADVASGGELSRIMLALKTVLADKDQIGTLIFDEIDAGISGRTAWKVSEKLAVLCRKRQVICITHLPQIAAMADRHFVIEKTTDHKSTRTDIRALPEGEEEQELARLLGGAQLTETALDNARELKKQADAVKTAVKDGGNA